MSQAEASPIHVVTETRNLRSTPFTSPEEICEIGKAWEDWLEAIEREFRYFKITDPEDKKDALIIYGGKEIARLEKSLPNPTDGNPYEKLKAKLNNHYLPKKNKHYARYQFLKTRRNPDETIVSYGARLRGKAIDCQFGNTQDERILEHIIQTIDNQSLIQKAISKEWDLTAFLKEASQIEEIKRQVTDITSTGATQNLNLVQAQDNHSTKLRRNPRHPNAKELTLQPPPSPCGYCGYKHNKEDRCPARGQICHNCNKANHFSSVCRAVPNRKENRTKFKQNAPLGIKKTTETDSTSSDDEYFIDTLKNTLNVKEISAPGMKTKTVTVRLDDVDVQVEPDSGADVNLMDEHQFKALLHRTKTKPSLEHCKAKLNTLQHQLEVKGEFKTTVRNQTCGKAATFIVVKGRIKSPPLLSKKTLEELGMIKIQPDGRLAQPNAKRIPEKIIESVHYSKDDPHQKEMSSIIEKHKHLFQGIGRIRDKKNDKEIYGQFHMKPDTVPVTQKPRPVPYHLQKPLKEWLTQGIQEDIFEKVPENEPITWCSPLVVQPKPKFAHTPKEQLGPNMIRASVDLRTPNRHMERNRITQTPIVEDFTHRFHDCSIWSKLDLRQGYHQLVLHPTSRAIATFCTPWGNFRPKRLVFGAKASQDLFDEAMQSIFGDIPRCLNQRDDLLIGAKDWNEHNKTLAAVLQRADDYGITFNKEKCEFGKRELEFYGYKFSQSGLMPTEDKVRAIKECSRPTSKADVRSFLGMTGYLAKFIPRYASLTKPLRDLTHKTTKFHWGQVEQAAFETLKHHISSNDTIAFFDPHLPTMLRTEASYNEGLSAGLFQKTSQGWTPVHFISRTLSDVEKRYSQTEKDALCVKWAKDRLSMYLLGAPCFTIVTAHKPLLPLFNKATSKLPPRIE